MVFKEKVKLGEALSAQTIQEVMHNAVAKAGFEKKATMITLRHRLATHFLETGIDIGYIYPVGLN